MKGAINFIRGGSIPCNPSGVFAKNIFYKKKLFDPFGPVTYFVNSVHAVP